MKVTDINALSQFKPVVIAGEGQYHSDKNGRQYYSLPYESIYELVQKPLNVPKEKGFWFIPSNYASRSFKAQKQYGRYALAWLDIDENQLGFKSLLSELTKIVGDINYIAYTTKSSTIQNQKMRVLIPLEQYLSYSWWHSIQKVLNNEINKLQGVVCGNKNTGAAQLCFLPNQGAYYDFCIQENNKNFSIKSSPIEPVIKLEHESYLRSLENPREQTTIKTKFPEDGDTPIKSFNIANPLPEILAKYGYKKRGERWISPNSSSGSPGVIVKDSRWISAHESDSDIGLKHDGGTNGDAFDLYVYYEFSGNRNEALNSIMSDDLVGMESIQNSELKNQAEYFFKHLWKKDVRNSYEA